jgi:hypothetical protein
LSTPGRTATPPTPKPSTPDRTPSPPPAAKLDGGYFVKGVNPGGSSYRGTASIDRKGERYHITWKISGHTFSGAGTLSGRTLNVKWSGDKGEGGQVTYTVMADGSLKGVWSNGDATETLVPIQ